MPPFHLQFCTTKRATHVLAWVWMDVIGLVDAFSR